MNLRNKRNCIALGGLLMLIGMLATSVFLPSVEEDSLFRIPVWTAKSVYANDGGTRMMTGDVPIGVVVALTGKHAEAYGFAMQRGFELAREEINKVGDVNLAFITVDDQSSVDGAKEAVRRLVDRGVSAIVGLAISTHLKEAAPIAQQHRVIAFSSASSAAGLSAIGDFIFRTSLATNISIPSGLTATKQKLGYKKVALIYDEIDVYSKNSNEVLRTALEANGVEILITETFQTGDTDLTRQLTNIAAAKPDALFISALSQEIAQTVAQTSDVNFPDNIDIIAPDLTMNEVQKAGDAAEGAIGFIGWSAMSDAPGNQSFVQNYRAKYGTNPSPGRRNRMQPSMCSPTQLRRRNPRNRPPFGTYLHKRRISPQF